ncbi:MAG TPA: BMP family ABC transporter substrate-binding protein [Methylibium sp.]|uniref:BMP family ABC transporter substrate-binding protein n=1 Tax=Methylibium sp. TaxID=2067992 RepID=UPI002DB80FED|nr:BMP family ABC transporter substrate-binding protein [Methylibium sp.]HEU4458230.1 BMP family ABC transporter substrate-binding protein [Methylibium sp.]
MKKLLVALATTVAVLGIAPAASAQEKAKICFIYVGSKTDGGWTQAHDIGRQELEKELGDKIETQFLENVPEGPDAERAIERLARSGCGLIFTTSFGFMDATIKVAGKFPDMKFEHATGYKTAPNMRIYDAKFYEDAYLAGVIAGTMTKTNTLGFVGSFPIPEVLRNINAYTLGAQSVNPKIRTKVVWVNTWFDPPKESEAAQSLINGGADVLLQNTDSSAVLQTAEKNGKYAFGWDSDMSAFAARAHLASAVAIWDGYYKKSIKEVIDGSWKTERTVWGVKEGQNDLIKIADAVPAEAKSRVDEIKARMRAGSFEVFTGPIVASDGKEALAAGVAADQAWKDKVDFYVKGVEGKIPSAK